MDIDYAISARVSMRTHSDANGVHYHVYADGQQRWYKYVRFGKDRRHRAGGPAFVEASRKQEEVAHAASLHDDRAM
jgi:hypothetical protein